ncbi:hypothetical protein [Streptomyces sp. NPDC059063]|uniref:hypothetical protein n=1 Tax=Streptomyces sp. NPDC059063 TaxID=3346712 RepID=UPI0036BF0632
MNVPPGATWYRGVDLIAVERALTCCAPYPPLTEAEQKYAATAASSAMPTTELAERIGTSERTVHRWRESGVAE